MRSGTRLVAVVALTLIFVVIGGKVYAAENPDDGVPDAFDNCLSVSNSSQADSDNDGFGNHCDGDLNQSGEVNVPDWILFSESWNQSEFLPDGTTNPQYNADADINSSGTVNVPDYILWSPTYGKPTGPSGLGANPDNDGYAGRADNCPNVHNDQLDLDLDGIGDPCDTCPVIANSEGLDETADCAQLIESLPGEQNNFELLCDGDLRISQSRAGLVDYTVTHQADGTLLVHASEVHVAPDGTESFKDDEWIVSPSVQAPNTLYTSLTGTPDPNTTPHCYAREDSTPAGMDIGLTKRLAAYPHPGVPVDESDPSEGYYPYFESCPGEAVGGCRADCQIDALPGDPCANVAPKSGFYTLATDQRIPHIDVVTGKTNVRTSCPADPESQISYDFGGYNTSVSCPYRFSWEDDPSAATIARIETDAQHFVSDLGAKQSIGIGARTPTPTIYAGMDQNDATQTPNVLRVNRVNSKVRAQKCFSQIGGANRTSYGRLAVGIRFWNYFLKETLTVAVNLDIYQEIPSGTAAGEFLKLEFYEQSEYDNPGIESPNTHGFFNAHELSREFVNRSVDMYSDETPDCSHALESVAWTEVEVNYAQLVRRLAEHKPKYKRVLFATANGANDGSETSYLGETTVGIETWGRAKVTAEVKDRTLYVDGDNHNVWNGDDADGDGIPDYLDNCPTLASNNSEQTWDPVALDYDCGT